jgi:hypothetical protein
VKRPMLMAVINWYKLTLIESHKLIDLCMGIVCEPVTNMYLASGDLVLSYAILYIYTLKELANKNWEYAVNDV